MRATQITKMAVTLALAWGQECWDGDPVTDVSAIETVVELEEETIDNVQVNTETYDSKT